MPEHAHGSHQLIYAIRGSMEVSAFGNLWLIPPHFALWIPAQMQHSIRMPGPVSMRTLYFRPELARARKAGCAVLHISSLLRELIVETVRIGRLRARHPLEGALRDLVISEVEKASAIPTRVTVPSEPRALAVARRVLEQPGQSQTLAALCAEAGVSVRTIERVFRKEAGIDFESWRRQVRLIKAIELLVSGHSVKEAAFAVGYRQCSAFIEGFRKTFGNTPKAWMHALCE